MALAAGDNQRRAGGQQQARLTHGGTVRKQSGALPGSRLLDAARAPQALLSAGTEQEAAGLRGTVGATLDPIMSLQDRELICNRGRPCNWRSLPWLPIHVRSCWT